MEIDDVLFSVPRVQCRLLLSICDQTLIEEAFDFFERQKLSLTPNSCSGYDTLNTETEFDVDSQQEKQGHMVDEGIDTPNSPMRSIVDLFKKRAAENGCKVAAKHMSTIEYAEN